MTGRGIDWTRIAITEEQIEERGLEPIWKTDNSYRPPREFQAWETEALGQGVIGTMVRDALDDLLPEPLGDLLEREKAEREAVAAVLDDLR